MNVFSFRAEFSHDLDLFIKECTKKNISLAVKIYQRSIKTPKGLWRVPEVDVEIATLADGKMLMAVLNEIEDSHRMMQTFRQTPLASNDLEIRDITDHSEYTPEELEWIKNLESKN